jgi:branched-chain amino acid transport system substrate-binding protein
VFNVVGTANNVTIREDLNENCVPNVFAATGSPTWGNPDYPWLIGSTLAPYTLETQAFADYLEENQPDAKVAMLVQDDDFGAAYEEGFASPSRVPTSRSSR